MIIVGNFVENLEKRRKKGEGGGGEMQKRRSCAPFSSCRVQRTEAAPLGRRWKRAATLDPRPVHAQWRIDPGESEMRVTSSSGPLAVYRIPFLRSDAAPTIADSFQSTKTTGRRVNSDASPSRSRSPTDHTNRQRFEESLGATLWGTRSTLVSGTALGEIEVRNFSFDLYVNVVIDRSIDRIIIRKKFKISSRNSETILF